VSAAPRPGEFNHADLERLRGITREAIAQLREAVARCRATAEEAEACRLMWAAARTEMKAETEARATLRARWVPPRATAGH
jgi:hypothetical protein